MTPEEQESLVLSTMPATCMSNLHMKLLRTSLWTLSHDELVALINRMIQEKKIFRNGRGFDCPSKN